MPHVAFLLFLAVGLLFLINWWELTPLCLLLKRSLLSVKHKWHSAGIYHNAQLGCRFIQQIGVVEAKDQRKELFGDARDTAPAPAVTEPAQASQRGLKAE